MGGRGELEPGLLRGRSRGGRGTAEGVRGEGEAEVDEPALAVVRQGAHGAISIGERETLGQGAIDTLVIHAKP